MAELLAKRLIRDIPDFPRPGVLFKDITPVLADAKAFQETIDRFVEWGESRAPDVVVGVESRGFVFAAPVALALGRGFVPIRKVGKLPHKTIQEAYTLEYGANIVEMHRDALLPGQRVLILDDLLATGGTAAAAARLAEKLGTTVVGFCFLVELAFLHGRDQLTGYDVQALITYSQ